VRTASDLLSDHEDPEAVAQIVADAIRGNLDYPGTFADGLATYAQRFGLCRYDGIALLRWFLDLVAEPDSDRWLREARLHQGPALAGQTVTVGFAP
jgi:hypothetical protein